MRSLLLVCMLMMPLASLFAQDVEAKEAMQGEPSSSLSAIRLANEMICYGYENKSAITLIDALTILSNTPTQRLNAKKDYEETQEQSDEEKVAKVSYDYATVLNEARDFANGDATLLGMIDKLSTESSDQKRGAVNGPSIHHDRVNAKSTDTYAVSFVGERLAEVAVSGDGDTDLDLYIYDSNGNIIVKDIDYTDDCYVCWVPAWTGKFYIKIVNRGIVYNNYVLLTN